MKRFSLPSLLAVVVVVLFAVSCSDQTTAPANSHALVAPTGVAGDLGKPPPPPVKVAMTITVESIFLGAPYTGVYFSNGTLSEGTLSEDGTPSETFDGTAWLRLDNKQPTAFGAASANARFMARDQNFSGNGTLFITGGDGNVHVVKIVDVTLFTPFSDCGVPQPGVPPSPCAIIEFRATVDGGTCNTTTGAGCHHGQATAFDIAANCSIIFVEGNGEDVPDHYEFDCPATGSEIG